MGATDGAAESALGRARLLPVGRRRHACVVAAAVLLTAAIVLAFAPVWPALHSQWTQLATYGHGYAVAAMAVWLAWRQWRLSPPATVKPDWRWLPVLAAVLALLVLMELLYLNVPRLFLLPPLLVAATGFAFGRDGARRVLWPSLLIYFALPVWEAINGTLQSMTTFAVSSALSTTRIPAFIEGNFVAIPAGRFEIAEGCSGLKYLLVAMTLAAFYGLAFLQTWPRRVLLLGVAVAAAIAGNWVRVYTIILVGHLTEMQSSLVEDHRAFGWLLFIGFQLPLMFLARRLEPRSPPAPRHGSRLGTTLRSREVVVAAIVASSLLGLTRAGLVAVSRAEGFPDSAGIEIAQGALAAPLRESSWQPMFANALETRAVVAGSAPPVEVYLALYPWQNLEHRLIAYGNSFVSESWREIRRRRISMPLRGESFTLLEMEGRADGRRRLVWGWYSVAGRFATGPMEAKLLEFRGMLAGRRDAAAVAISTECDIEDCRSARERLSAALRESVVQLEWTP